MSRVKIHHDYYLQSRGVATAVKVLRLYLWTPFSYFQGFVCTRVVKRNPYGVAVLPVFHQILTNSIDFKFKIAKLYCKWNHLQNICIFRRKMGRNRVWNFKVRLVAQVGYDIKEFHLLCPIVFKLLLKMCKKCHPTPLSPKFAKWNN